MVSTFEQPDITTHDENTWPAKVDDAVAVLHGIAGAFAAHQQTTADLTVRIDAGATWNVDTKTRTAVAAQSTSALTAPTTNPRSDIVYLDESSGAVGVATGTENASPVDPAVPAGKFPVARINWTVGMTEITNADLDDLRVAFPTGWLKPDGDGSSLTGIGSVDQTARDMAASATVLALIVADATAIAGPFGSLYLVDNFGADSLTTKTNATYNAAGDFYETAFSETIETSALSPSNTTNGGQTYVDRTYALDPNSTVTKIGVFNTQASSSIKVKIVERTSASTYDVDVDQAYSHGGTGWEDVTLSTPFVVPGTGDFYAALHTVASISGDTSGNAGATVAGDKTGTGQSITDSASTIQIPRTRVYYQGSPLNMTLAPAAATLGTADPTDILAYVVIDPQEVITLGTHIIFTSSIDGGTTDATGAWTKVGDVDDAGLELYRLDCDVSAQTGSSLTYEITTANNKEIRYHACGGLVAIY